MAPSLMEHAFELFIQATRKTDRSKGGLGVGLALSKRLVQLHGGVLSAHSAGQNQGSEFIMSLPALQQAVEPRQLATTQVHPIAAQAGLKVLIVDDNVDAAELLRLLLESTGHTVHVEYHPIRALEQARAFAPDVCLLDIGLPEISGNELARRLRQLPAMADAALIAITGYGQPQDRADALAAGFDYHLVKPVDRLQLLATLADIARTCVVN